MPNLAIADAIPPGTKITYIGSKKGIESQLVPLKGIQFISVQTGKFRRYFSLLNFIDLFRIPIGIIQAYLVLRKIKPNIVFSKGGFVGFPVVVAAWLRRIPAIIHESDAIPGLATKLCAPFAKKILLGYKQTNSEAFGLKYKKKTQVVGNPIRPEILKGSTAKAKKLTGFKGKKPVLLIIGGSAGAQQLNKIVREEKDRLTEIFDVIHITGKGKGRKQKSKSYFAIPYANKEMKDLYALASLALSRAGANSLAEFEALKLPTLLYPLGRHQSRGDQMANTQAMIRKHKFFSLAAENKEAHSQLILLPKRSKKQLPNDSAQKIANLIMQIYSQAT